MTVLSADIPSGVALYVGNQDPLQRASCSNPEGRIAFIAQEAEFTPKNVQTEKERVKLVYRIKIDIVNPEMELKPGMPADAVIYMGK